MAHNTLVKNEQRSQRDITTKKDETEKSWAKKWIKKRDMLKGLFGDFKKKKKKPRKFPKPGTGLERPKIKDHLNRGEKPRILPMQGKNKNSLASHFEGKPQVVSGRNKGGWRFRPQQ